MGSYRLWQSTVLSFLLISVMALLIAPILMPESYDWVTHTTSESGAQGIEGAWLARSGFVLYGLAVLLLIAIKKDWKLFARLVHAIFGLSMMGNAVFSSRPWLAELPFDALEDTLHSWMSGLVGSAFTVGVRLPCFCVEKQTGFQNCLIVVRYSRQSSLQSACLVRVKILRV